jgi:hypothetical protein
MLQEIRCLELQLPAIGRITGNSFRDGHAVLIERANIEASLGYLRSLHARSAPDFEQLRPRRKSLEEIKRGRRAIQELPRPVPERHAKAGQKRVAVGIGSRSSREGESRRAA